MLEDRDIYLIGCGIISKSPKMGGDTSADTIA